ncbi:MAG: undecaprenyl-diphosphate phosphatase, partial [Deltaproteobacteria bacterium]|nr:undecaprenyl-diphosphate phosphatase [Deltaproteobacteria bacterium]
IVTAKLMGLDPVSPEMTLLLVMLHTGTMFAVLIYFWKSWRRNYFQSLEKFWTFAKLIIVATFFTGVLGLALKFVIEKVFLRHVPHAEIELIFGNMTLISIALFSVGCLIIYAGRRKDRPWGPAKLGLKESSWIGAVQGVCL